MVESGAPAPREEFHAALYEALRDLARHYMRRERNDHTLQPTALVHEAYLRLARQDVVHDALSLRRTAATMMRRVLVDHERARRTAKRGGKWRRVTLSGDGVLDEDRPLDPVELSELIDVLATLDPLQAQIVELRFFGGLSIDETIEVLGISRAKYYARWRMARAWLRHRLAEAEGGDA